MNIGLLWFDNDPKSTLEAKIAGAVEYYQKKYLHSPTLCYIHPSMMPPNQNGNKLELAGVEVRSSRSVLPNHFWLGVEIE